MQDLIWLVKRLERNFMNFGFRNNSKSNEIKDIMKVIKSLENRGILIKGTTTKMTSQEGEFLNFLRSLMTAGLLLMKVYSLH